MEFFNKYFGEKQENDQGEVFVLCPFPHTDDKGNTYYETKPSAHISTEKSVFHCKVCGTGMSEPKFVMQTQGVTYKEALQILKQFENHEGEWIDERKNFLNSPAAQKIAIDLGIFSVHDELKLGYLGEGIEFPVFMEGTLLDVRTYRPGGNPKVLSRKGKRPLILPYDLWKKDERPTLLCAGEKDMAISRAKGFNAITFTGGENAFPKLWKSSFKGKHIYIAYDNDSAGQTGARAIASLLLEAGAIPHVVTAHYEVCTEKGEDIHDFFQKYNKTAADLQTILDNTQPFSAEDHIIERDKRIPNISLQEATKGEYSNKLVSSRVSVVATFEDVFQIPDYVEIEKVQYVTDKDMLQIGWKKEWVLDTNTMKDILELMDLVKDEEKIIQNLKKLVGCPLKEQGMRIRQLSKMNVFKAVVTDDRESEVTKEDEEVKPLELLVYSIGKRIEAGQKYRMVYKPTPHPHMGMKMVGVVQALEEADTSISNFSIQPNVLDSMKCFQVQEGQSVQEKMDEIFERSKGFCGAETQKGIQFAVDLFYHTPLQFQFGKRVERAYLDSMIVGESRTGKSQTTKRLLEMYELGVFTSLKTSTKAGLIGGSDQGQGGWKTKLGIIPRNHKGAVIMEEFSGGGKDVISSLTDIRSSNVVRIDRVNGSTRVPAFVRMLSISNQAVSSTGLSIPLRQYPHGIQVLLDLIGAAEDIARYDFFLLVDEPKEYTSPLDDTDLEPFPKESYMNRVRWIWSRKPDQIKIDDVTKRYIIEVAENLNQRYNSHVKFFGAEAWKKVARVAIATAACVCSFDETGENLIVTNDHVSWAKNFLVRCYDNDIFRLKEYVDQERKYSETDSGAVQALQGLFNNHRNFILQLEMTTQADQRQLQMVSGLDTKDFAGVMNTLVGCCFVTIPNGKVVPTKRFRDTMRKIDRNTYVKKVGEV